MSDQSYAAPNDPYWLSSRGVKSVHFLKQDAPPLAYADGRGALYELTDGILYFNGVPLSGGGGGGDVSSSISSTIDNKVCRFDSTTGKLIQDSNLIIDDGSADRVQLDGRLGVQTIPMLMCTDSTQKTTLGLRTPQDTDLGIGSTAIGNGAMQLTTGATNCVAIGADALFQLGTGNNNTAVGAAAGLQLTGTDSRNVLLDSPGVAGDNNTIRVGNPLFHTDCYIQGIRGSTPALVSPEMVIVDADGKLSSQAIPTPGGSGDVVGPAGSTDNAVALYDGVTGKLIKNSSMLYTLNTNAPRIDISGWENLLFTQANHSQFMGYKSGNTFANSQLGNNNTSFGGSSMQAHTGGSDNTAVGGFALFSKTNQGSNTAVGSSALQNLNAGSGANTAIGAAALSSLVSGTANICIGNNAGSFYTTTESNNILIGNVGVIADSATIRVGSNTQTSCFIAREFKSNGSTLRIGNQAGLGLLDTDTTSGCTLVGNQTGINSSSFTNTTAVGSFAARYSTGNSNTVCGSNSLSGLSATGNNNAILGWNCAASTTSAQGNVIVGTNGAIALTSGSTNTLLGNSVAQQLTTGSSNICIAGAGGGGGTLATGSNNILIGANAPLAATATSIIIGSATQTSTSIAEDFRSNNTITRVGYRAGNVATTSATASVLVGSSAGLAITSATGNTLVGSGAGAGLTGAVNTVVGAQSLDNAGAQANNTVVGATTARSCTSNDNVILGHIAAQQLTTSPNNIIIGKGSGQTLATGTGGGIYIAANAASATEAGTIRIGTAATQTRAFISGISGVTTTGAAVACLVDANGQLGTVSSSRLVKQDIRPIESTDWLHQLELCNFEYINGTVLSEDPESPDYNKKQKQVGVIAEDVELIKPELVIMQGNGVKTVDYNALYVCALKELQKVRADHDALDARLASLVDRVASLEAAAALP